MPVAFEESFTVCNHECDPFGRMSPGAALRRIQDISVNQCTHLGIDDSVYQRVGAIFLLNRTSLVIKRMPAEGEAVRIQTRAYGMVRAQFHRVTTLYGTAGEKLCETDTRWVLVNIAERRILRRPPEDFPMPFNDANVVENHDLKFPKPDSLCQLAEMHATYTLCDTNGHINNTRYVDMLCDHLPIERLRTAPPRRMVLAYHNEIALGHSFAVHCGAGEKDFYFLASENGKRNFEGYVEF